MNIFKEIKYFYQRGKRGYSDRDAWDFDDYLSSIIIKGVRDLKENVYGCPGDLYDKDRKNDEYHKWKEILEEIASGFEAAQRIKDMSYMKRVKKDKYYTTEVDEKKAEAMTKKYERGMKLFSKYFLNLWD